MSPGKAQTKAEDQDVVSRLLQHDIAVIFVFLTRHRLEEFTGRVRRVYHCALGGLFRYVRKDITKFLSDELFKVALWEVNVDLCTL